MKKTFKHLAVLLASAIAFSCSSDEDHINSEDLINAERRIAVIAEDFTPTDGTRTAYTENENGYSFKWIEGDELGIFPTEGRQTAFPINQESAGSNTALFDGGKWALRPNESYAAYYPLNESLSIDKTAIPVSYLGQTQDGNGDTRHLAQYDYMASTFTQVDAKGNVNFHLKHLGSLVQFKLTMPKADIFNKVEITSDNAEFITEGTFDLTSEEASIITTRTSKTITINLKNISTDSDNQQISINTLFAPVDFSESTLKVEVYSASRTYTFFYKGKDMTCSNAYNPIEDTDVEFIPYITFEAEEVQTLKLSRAVSTLEYSLDNGDWTELKTATVTFGGDNGKLRLRGKSSTGTATNYGSSSSSTITFSTPAKVKCYGDIRTLVDYEQYNSISTKTAKFCNLFKNCTALISGPELPANELASYCYSNLFEGCTSLIYAPELPAANLDSYCYQYMFKGCTSLISAPELPATTLASYCYYYMFENCISLTKVPNKLPAMKLENYCYRYMFTGCTSLLEGPELPATKLADYCYSNMFAGCTSLVNAPELPATDVYDYCYFHMFRGCTSLTDAPYLPALTLVSCCYMYMFNGCSSLNYIKMMATETASDCMYHWTEGVASTGTFVKNKDAKWTTTGVSGVPTGWTVVLDSIEIADKECVDLGLSSGTLWATTNIGASSPEEFGDPFAWGEITTKSSFTLSNYKYCEDPKAYVTTWKKYSIKYISDDKKTSLDLKDDAAYAKFGEGWRMPSYSQALELVENCTFETSEINGTTVVTATGPNGNSIIFPICDSSKSSSVIYWTRDLETDYNSSNYACDLSLSPEGTARVAHAYRIDGAYIRPVQKKQ